VSSPDTSVTRRGRDLEPALVMGDVDLLRSLALARIPCAVFGPPGDPLRWSRHARFRLDWADPWEEQDEVVDTLLDFARAQPRPPVLFPGTDADLLVASRHRARLAGEFLLPLADSELVEDLVDKARFAALAERAGLPVPRGRLIDPTTTAPTDVDLRFPIVVKPLTRHLSRWAPVESAAKALHLDSPRALAALWPRLAEAQVRVFAQEAVSGSEARIESYHAYVDADGRIGGEFTGRKIRTRPTQYGHSTAVEITVTEDVAALGREVLARLELRGIAKADFKRAPDGTLRLLEINPRFSLWHHPAALAGVNLPALVHADLTGHPRPERRPVRPGVRWCLPLGDVLAARSEGWSVRRWLGWAARCQAVSGFAWDDPLPIAAAVRASARRRLRERGVGDPPRRALRRRRDPGCARERAREHAGATRAPGAEGGRPRAPARGQDAGTAADRR
jgi:D-aspartate ligase